MSRSRDLAANRRKLGLPDGIAFERLVASDPGGCVVVKARVSGEPLPSSRLFVRAFDETVYREITWPAGCNSFEDPVVLEAKPEMYVLGEHRQNGGGDGVGLYRVTLPDGSINLVHSGRGTHSAGSDDEGGWWLAQLLGATSGGAGLLVSLATSIREPTGARVEYTVAMFGLETGRLSHLTPLPTVFA